MVKEKGGNWKYKSHKFSLQRRDVLRFLSGPEDVNSSMFDYVTYVQGSY